MCYPNIDCKEMEYTNIRKDKEVLCDGKYKNYHFEIISYGTHPCAYVRIDDSNNRYFGMDYDEITDIHCHGGLTFSEPHGENKETWLIGWDYAHAGDYVGYQPSLSSNFIDSMIYDDWGNDYGKKYTVKEILEDVYDVIDQIIYNNAGDK